MRAILHIGTRACRTALHDALREHLDPVLLLVPPEPALLGPALDSQGLDDDLRLLADLVLTRASAQARQAREDASRSLAGVFDAEPTASDQSIDGLVLDGPIADALAPVLREHGIQDLWMSREALELLDQAGVDTAQAISAGGAELQAR